MVEPLLEAHTEWIEEGLDEIEFRREQTRESAESHGKVLKWVCPDCDVDVYTKRRYGTKRCPECERIMQSANYSVDPQNPDPQNPKPFLRAVAKRRGFPYDYYFPDDEPEIEDPLDW